MPSVIAFIFGTMVGSFLNVCILRLPKEESVVFPPSHCTKCQKAIAWHDNIPILSYLILGGRCRWCRDGISIQYPLIEALTGCLFVVFYQKYGLQPVGFVYLYLSLALLVQTVIDWRYKIIPDEVSLPAIVVGLLASLVFPSLHGQSIAWKGLLFSAIGMLAGGGFLYAVGSIAERILKKEAMGMGDVKLLAGIGAILGWKAVFWSILISSFTGSVVGVYYKIRRGDELIPYGPFLALGAFSYLFVGPSWMAWYFNWLRGL